jgi:hypothetical protein
VDAVLRRRGRRPDYGVHIPLADNSIILRTPQATMEDRLGHLEEVADEIAHAVRDRARNDVPGQRSASLAATGLQIWHVDAADGAEWGEFLFNNMNTRHKLVRLMEADGREDIEALREDDTGEDLYRAGQSFGPATIPSSRPYWGTNSGVSVTGIAQIGDAMTCTLTAGTNDLDFKAPVTKAVVRYGAYGSTFVTLKVSDRFPTWTRYKIGSSSRWEIWHGGTTG